MKSWAETQAFYDDVRAGFLPKDDYYNLKWSFDGYSDSNGGCGSGEP